MSNLNVANTIRQQIHHGVGVDGSAGSICMMAWGASQFVGCGEETENNQGWLSFRVQGRKFKGTVKVKLMWNDTYRVEFWKGRGTKIRVVDSADDVYFDELAPTIDLYVEAD